MATKQLDRQKKKDVAHPEAGQQSPSPSLSPSPSSSLLLLSLWASSPWPLILGFIFGGCCSNAYFLELGTSAVPSAGTLITFAQFLATALTCIPTQLYRPPGSSSLLPRLKNPKVPLSRWSVQIILYLTTSLLNNAAFAYDIPMSVHIVFRSGGLVINMLLGWAVQGRKYNLVQIASVLLVTVGVVTATLFAQESSSSSSSTASTSNGERLNNPTNYLFGVSLLFLALVLSGLMGLYQERTFRIYGRDNWQEALFYSHVLSLPIFLLRWKSLAKEIVLANQTEPFWIGWLSPNHSIDKDGLLSGSLGTSTANVLDLGTGCLLSPLVPKTGLYYSTRSSLASCRHQALFRRSTSSWTVSSSAGALSLTMPSFWPVLLLNVLTQLLCINGVNRMTSQVTSLTVTLVLVIRKALSLAISVVLVGGRTGNPGLWAGAGAVLLGTVGYTLGSSAASKPKTKTEPAASASASSSVEPALNSAVAEHNGQVRKRKQ
ncbi:golgi uridine diphosphate-N- acetylglucosamine transporter [Tilletia horrida]|nr:golgi uridine diphosphate-N- acetylglucosamine transporter [Tilletia horrida]